jgi:glutaminase
MAESGMNDRAARVASPVLHYLEELHAQIHRMQDGKVADYIPELARANPDWFGIAIVTVDGHIYQVGDSREPFTIQSVSKPFVYGMALEDRGLEEVMARVGVEPSGDAFNSISLDPVTGRPLNPMINAGAIATAGMIEGKDVARRMARVLENFARYLDHPLAINESVYQSERDTGHRNRAICHMLRNFGMLPDPPEEALDLYFRQCSIEVNCRDLAMMAATLASNGVNPITAVRALKSENVERLLSIMTTCGTYDYAGNWIYDVGLPAKSGVGGGILAVLPGQMGIGVFSPRLDAIGNSVRGLETCRRLSKDFKLHMFNTSLTQPSVIRNSTDGSRSRSTRLRDPQAASLLDAASAAIRIYELTGDLGFVTTEAIVATMLKEIESADFFLLDMKRVFTVDVASVNLFAQLCRNLHAAGKFLFFTQTDDKFAFSRDVWSRINGAGMLDPFQFADNDHALEWCENRLLGQQRADLARERRAPGAHPYQGPERRGGVGPVAAPAASMARQALLRGLDAEEMAFLLGLMNVCEFDSAETILRQNDSGDEVYFIERGEVAVGLTTGRKRNRLAVLSAGMVFGELALVERNVRRTADVYCKTATRCRVLSATVLDAQTGEPAGAVRQKLLRNLNHLLLEHLRRDHVQIRLLV